MNLNNFTIKSQEAIQKAVEIASNNSNQSIETLHLMKGIMNVDGSVAEFLFNKLGVNSNSLRSSIDREINMLPKVSGGEPYLSRECNEVLVKAEEYSKKSGDQFVAMESIIMAMIMVKNRVRQFLKDVGISDLISKSNFP